MAEDLSPEDLVFRRATFNDYKQVMGFSGNTFGGSDYLPAMFYPILHNTNMSAFVVEHNGEVLGFIAVIRLSDGKTQYWIGGRTKPGYEKLGIQRLLVSHCYSVTQTEHPELSTQLSVGVPTQRYLSFVERNPMIENQLEWVRYIYKAPPSKLRDALASISGHIPVVPSAKSLSYQQSLAAIPEMIAFFAKLKYPYINANPSSLLLLPINSDGLRRMLMTTSCICSPGPSGVDFSALSIYDAIINPGADGVISGIHFHGDSMQLYEAHMAAYFELVLRLIPPDATTVAILMNCSKSMSAEVHQFMKERFGDNIQTNEANVNDLRLTVVL